MVEQASSRFVIRDDRLEACPTKCEDTGTSGVKKGRFADIIAIGC
jgi:hypothetical protein